MAIFIAIAWIIEAADYLGLIETEAQDPRSRAYRLAHQVVGCLKRELSGRPWSVEAPDSVLVLREEGERRLEVREHELGCFGAGLPDVRHDLGPSGSVHFLARQHALRILVAVRTVDGGAHDLELTIPYVEESRSST